MRQVKSGHSQTQKLEHKRTSQRGEQMSRSQTVPDALIEKLIELTKIVKKLNERIMEHEEAILSCQDDIDDLFDKCMIYVPRSGYNCPFCGKSNKNDNSIL